MRLLLSPQLPQVVSSSAAALGTVGAACQPQAVDDQLHVLVEAPVAAGSGGVLHEDFQVPQVSSSSALTEGSACVAGVHVQVPLEVVVEAGGAGSSHAGVAAQEDEPCHPADHPWLSSHTCGEAGAAAA